MKKFDPLRYYGILLIFILEAFALKQGVDGVALSISIGAISGLAGYAIAKRREKS